AAGPAVPAGRHPVRGVADRPLRLASCDAAQPGATPAADRVEGAVNLMGIGVMEPRGKMASAASIAKLRALVLLAGSVRPTRLGTAIGRPLFELPLQKGTSILDAWRREAWQLGQAVEQPALPVRIMIDRSAQEVRTPAGHLTEAMAPL